MKAFLVVLLAVFSGKLVFLKKSFSEITEHQKATTTELINESIAYALQAAMPILPGRTSPYPMWMC